MYLLPLTPLLISGRSKSNLYTVSKKNIPDVFSYNLRKHCRILIIFGRNIVKKASNQTMLYFSTSPDNVSALPCKTENTENVCFR